MALENTQGGPPRATRVWTRVFASLYDPLMSIGERAGMRARRAALLSRARGATLELGSGTGLNLAHYPSGLDELTLAEPVDAMRERLQAIVRRTGSAARVIDAPAERLPFPDSSMDTIVSTLVLCTVDDPQAALTEVIRVLRPQGQLLFVEHVRADSPPLARWQDRLAGPWRHVAEGCRCNRPTAELMRAAGLELDLREQSWRGMPAIVRPLIAGAGTPGPGRTA